MVDGDVVRRGEFVPVEGGAFPCDGRPRLRVSGGFAGEVTSVEFGEGVVEIVEVERHDCREPLVGVDLDDLQDIIEVERLGRLLVVHVSTLQDEALPAGGNDGRRKLLGPDLCDGLHVRDFGIPTASHTGVDNAATIVVQYILGHHFGHGVPVAGYEARLESLDCLASRVFQPR